MMKYTQEEMDLWREVKDFAQKASGERKTKVGACLVWPDGRRVFGANRLRDGHDLTEAEIAERVKPKFYDAMKCGEPDAIDKAEELGFDLAEATLYTMLFPCPRCAEKIQKTNLKRIIALTHRTRHNGTFTSPLQASCAIFDAARIVYDIGEPDDR